MRAFRRSLPRFGASRSFKYVAAITIRGDCSASAATLGRAAVARRDLGSSLAPAGIMDSENFISSDLDSPNVSVHNKSSAAEPAPSASSRGDEAAWIISALRDAAPHLPCVRYLYDDEGSELFEKITDLPEYYPTRTEAALLRKHATSIARFSDEPSAHADGCGGADSAFGRDYPSAVIELGAGSGKKMRPLIDASASFARCGFTYVPVNTCRIKS